MNRYPTDEELEQFISNIEKQELYAPRNMKSEILNKAFSKQTVQVLPKPKSNEQALAPSTKVVSIKSKYAMLSYRLKIIAGMAAAVVALFIVPLSGGMSNYADKLGSMAQRKQVVETEETEPEISTTTMVNSAMCSRAREANQKLSSWMNYLGNLFENENGGNS